MAKVKIQGHASGTGVLTVTAPNTSTDRTITLPDSTGTLAVNSDVTNKLPLAGGTLTGNLLVQSASTGATASTDADDLVIEGTNGGISILNATTGQGNIFFGDSGDNDIGKIAYNHTANTMYFITNGGVRTSLTPDGLTFNGDTAAANALDDYEVGAWTPSGTNVAGSSVGLYTKIGNMCFIQGWLIASGGSTGSDISGLPFASGNGSSNAVGGGTVLYSNDTITGLYVNGGGATTFHLFNRAANAVITNTSQMHFTLAYRTT